jgi:DNA-binding transcriptional LysR family regulator
VDRLDELRVFTTILEAGSLRAAARRLHRSASSVTRSLAAIEERIGGRLVERTTRHLVPTEAGRRLAERARQLLSDYGAALGEASDAREASLRGLLRVTAPTVFGRRHVIPVVASFLDIHPAVRAELVLSDRNLDMIEEGFDVAVRIGRLTESRLVARRVGEVRRVLIASTDYLSHKGNPRRPSDLARHDLVYCGVLSHPMEWRFRSNGRDQIVRLVPRLIFNDVEATLLAVKAGRGIGRLLSYQVCDELASGTLVRLFSKFEPPAFPVHLVVTTARHMPAHARAFLDHAGRLLKALSAIHP